MQGLPPQARAVYEMLASRILTEQRLAGEILSSDPAKTVDLAVAKNTLRAAVTRLREDGLVRIDGRRNRVVDDAVLPAAVLAAARSFAELSQQHGVGIDNARLAVLGMWNDGDSSVARRQDTRGVESAGAVIEADVQAPALPPQDVFETPSPQLNAFLTPTETSEAVSPSEPLATPIDSSEPDAWEFAEIMAARDEDPDDRF